MGCRISFVSNVLCLTVLVSWGLGTPGHGLSFHSVKHHDRNIKVVVGLSYSPAFSGVAGFDISETGETTKSVLPYLRHGGATVLRANNFDWAATDSDIAFGNSTDVALAGSVGLKVKSGRIELEVGHELFATAKNDTERKQRNEPGYYVLSKMMSYDVINGNTKRLRDNLAAQSPEDIETFAHILKTSHPDVDKMMCRYGRKLVVGPKGKKYPDIYTRSSEEYGGDCTGRRAGLGELLVTETDPGLYAAISDYGHGAWPQVSKKYGWCHDNKWMKCAREDASYYVAREITTMDLDSKTVVAGHLAKVVEGGEVVELRSVSSTSVMVNACYDAELSKFHVMPYACLGFGGNFVGVAGTVSPKLAYKLKAGVAYRISSLVSAYLGGFFHHVIGDGEYKKLQVHKLVDDISPEGRTGKSAVASFGLSYSGYEMGFRLMF